MTIKKVIAVSLISGITAFSYGQKLETTNAAMAYKPLKSNPMWMMMDKDGSMKKELYDAKSEIDKAYEKYKASNTLKPKDEAKLFFYRGMIYLDYMMSADSSMLPELEKNEEAYNEAAFGSLKKCKELDTRGMYSGEIEAKMQTLRSLSLQGGVTLFQNKDYKNALASFEAAKEFFDVIGKTDSLAIYNAALAADNLGDAEKAYEYYKKSADIGYKTEASYQGAIRNLNKKNGGPSDEVLALIEEGKKKNPGSMALIIEEFNYYIGKGDAEKAQASLSKAIEKDPNNPIFHFNIGATFDELATKKHKEGKHDEAELYAKKAIAAYKKAIELKPDFVDAYYNLGVFYNNESFELNSLINEIKDEALYAKEKARAKEYLNDAIPYLEKAHELEPKDVNSLKLLKSIYFNLEKDADYERVNNALKELGQ